MDKEEQLRAIGRRIKEIREARGMSQSELANRVGYKSRSSINKIELGKNDIVQSKIKSIANALSVTPAVLLGIPDTFSSIFDIENISPMPGMQRVPRLGDIACGEPIFADEEHTEYDQVPDFVKCDFTLVCRGDSMINARIHDGDIVCVKRQPTVNNGEIAVVLIDDEATLKRVYIGEGYMTLSPENPQYSPHTYVGDQMADIRILGKATHFISSVK